MTRVFPVLPCVAYCVLSLGGCSNEYALQVSASDDSLLNAAVRIQLAVVDDCADQAPASEPVGIVRTIEFAQDEQAPSVGNVPPGSYGLYARAFDAECEVVAAGCTPVLLESGGGGTLSVQLTRAEGRRCEPSLCREGACVPAPDGGSDGPDGGSDGPPRDIANDLLEDGVDMAVGSDGSLDAFEDGVLDAPPDTATDGSIDADGAAIDMRTLDPDLLIYLSCDRSMGAAIPNLADETNNATCVGDCPALRDGPAGPACFFDGLGQHLELASDERFNLADGLTVSLWVRPQQVGLASLAAVPVGTGNSNTWQVDQPTEDDMPLSRFLMRAGARLISINGPTLELDRWTHLAATWDGASVVFYVNGEAVGSVLLSGTARWDDQSVFIAADRNAGVIVNRFRGGLDEVRMYADALSPADVAALARE
ncbi:MAG: LamG domain-containing protein [Myxococcota bacterium]